MYLRLENDFCRSINASFRSHAVTIDSIVFYIISSPLSALTVSLFISNYLPKNSFRISQLLTIVLKHELLYL